MDQNCRAFAAVLALTGACSVADEEDLGESIEPVINGTPVATDTLGVPKIVTASGSLCSATLWHQPRRAGRGALQQRSSRTRQRDGLR